MSSIKEQFQGHQQQGQRSDGGETCRAGLRKVMGERIAQVNRSQFPEKKLYPRLVPDVFLNPFPSAPGSAFLPSLYSSYRNAVNTLTKGTFFFSVSLQTGLGPLPQPPLLPAKWSLALAFSVCFYCHSSRTLHFQFTLIFSACPRVFTSSYHPPPLTPILFLEISGLVATLTSSPFWSSLERFL